METRIKNFRIVTTKLQNEEIWLIYEGAEKFSTRQYENGIQLKTELGTLPHKDDKVKRFINNLPKPIDRIEKLDSDTIEPMTLEAYLLFSQILKNNDLIFNKKKISSNNG